MMVDNFEIKVVVEHGYPHYKVIDTESGRIVHCDINELNEVIDELEKELYEIQ